MGKWGVGGQVWGGDTLVGKGDDGGMFERWIQECDSVVMCRFHVDLHVSKAEIIH